MIKTLRIVLFCLSLALLISACGGGGGGNSEPSPAPTKAILKVSTANVPAGTRVSGVQMLIVLPAGVTPSVLSGIDSSGSVAPSGNAAAGSTTSSSYNASTKTLTLAIINGNGFVSGEFMTITCTIAAGTTVTAANFPLQATVTEVLDSNSNPNRISGATCPISVTFQ
jgi:hypothetical protein